MVQYYTLQEAAARLRISVDELKEMAKRNELRAFQDRGTLRFRAQEIDELARLRGLGSDVDLQLADQPTILPGSPPRTQRPGGQAPGAPPSVFEFSLSTDSSEDVPLAEDLSPGGSGARGSKPGGPKTPATPTAKPGGPKSSGPKPAGPSASGVAAPGGPKSSGPKPGGPASSSAARTARPAGSGVKPPPPSASDSDVRLVAEGGDLDFQLAAGPASAPPSPAPPPSGGPRSSGVRPGGPKSSGRRPVPPRPGQADSSVRIVPLGKAGDSDIKMVPDEGERRPPAAPTQRGSSVPSDSDVRLHPGKSGMRPGSDPLVTEEIDLDAEAARAEQEGKTRAPQKPRPRPTQVGPPPGPSASPFELTESGIAVPGQPPSSSGLGGAKAPGKKGPSDSSSTSSSDFELGPATGGPSSSSGPGGSHPPGDESPVLMGDEDVNLGELGAAAGGSGINLQDPADSGISLEQGSSSDEVEFELSLDAGSTPPPAPPEAAEEQTTSSSEFELSVDPGASQLAVPGTPESDSDSEFELSLDAEEAGSDPSFVNEADSDSEFELTLDDSGNLSKAAEEAAAGGDIFETDADVPSLDADSGSEAVALEETGTAEAAGGDFDMALNEEDAPPTEETGSQVVALEDEEEVGENVETVARTRRGRAAAEGEELGEDLDEELGEETEVSEPAAAGVAPPAPWGPLPALVLIPAVLVLFFVSLMSFELVHSMWGYHRPGKVSSMLLDPLARALTDMPKE
jgi:excisionase family DNA binding protein